LVESAKAWPTDVGRPALVYRLLDLTLNDHDVASQAVTRPEAGAYVPNAFALGPVGLRILFAVISSV